MALTRLYQFDTGTTLTESDIEGEFDQIYGSALSLVSPWTGNMAAGGNLLTGLSLGAVSAPSVSFTGDTNTGIYSSTADTVDVAVGGIRAASFGATFLLNAAPEDARTNSVDVAGEIRSTTSGAPAAGIGVGLLFSAESGDENPSSFGQVEFAATDIGAGSEDTYLSILLRAAGAALDEKYRFSSTSGAGFAALFTHANTVDMTYTLPDADSTFVGAATQAEMETATSNTVAATPGRTQYHPGVAKFWLQAAADGTITSSYNIASIGDAGVGDLDVVIATDFSSTAYVVVAMGGGGARIIYMDSATQTAGSFSVFCRDDAGALADPTHYYLVGFGDQ